MFQSVVENPDLKKASVWMLSVAPERPNVRLTNIAFGWPFYEARFLHIMDGFEGTISIEGIENYTQLEIFKTCIPVDDLSGMEFCSNLTDIKLTGKANLAVLSDLRLTRLDLSQHHNLPGDFECLQLENVEYLIINRGHVRYLGPDDRYQSLKTLHVRGHFPDPKKFMMKLFGKTDLNGQTAKTSALLPRLSERITRWALIVPYVTIHFS